MLKLIQFFESNPERMTVTSIVQRSRAARVKNGKEVKGPLKQVRTFIIDGVEKIYDPAAQAHEYVIRPRGWHNRLHDVIGHWRHIERSLTVCTCCSPPKTAIWISPFERGDETLGRVETDKRFRVSPADVFLHDLAARPGPKPSALDEQRTKPKVPTIPPTF